MRKTLAVAARELQERWLLLPGGLALGFVPLVLPAFGVDKEMARLIGFWGAVLLGVAAALVAGYSMLARDADDGRLSFLFGRPVPWPAIWSGKWIAASLLAGASGLLAATPWMAWMAVDPLETSASWWRAIADPRGWIATISIVVLIVGSANFAATAFRARSAWLAVDLTLLLVALWAVRRFVAPLVLVGILSRGSWSPLLLLAPLPGALLLASAGQVAIGRTDLRRAHRALSIGFWAVAFSLLTAAAGLYAWVERAAPTDLRAPYFLSSAPDSRWIYIEGTTNRGGWYSPRLLVDTVDGRYLRTVDLKRFWGQDQYPGVGFSADGRFAVKWKGAKAATRLTLIDLRGTPPHIAEVALEASGPPSFLTAACLSSGAEAALVVQGSSASLVALPSGRAIASAPLPPGWRVAAARLMSATQARLWLGRTGEPAATPAQGPFELRIIELAANASPTTLTVPTDAPLSRHEIVPSSDGERLLTFDRGLVLRSGADGAVVARLVDNAKVNAARFLGDGRIVALSREGNRSILRTFTADGALSKRVTLDVGLRPTTLSLGPEVRPGQIVIATGTPLTFVPSDSVLVEVAEGRVVERLEGLRPAPTHLFARDIQARAPAGPAFPPSHFVNGSGQVIQIDFATGQRRVIAGPGAPKGERLKGI